MMLVRDDGGRKQSRMTVTASAAAVVRPASHPLGSDSAKLDIAAFAAKIRRQPKLLVPLCLDVANPIRLWRSTDPC